MSTASPDPGPDAADLAPHLRSAGFVRVVTRADGDGVAAAGLLARALSAAGVPFQVTAARTDEGRRRRVDRAQEHATPEDATLVVGDPAAEVPGVAGGDRPDSAAAWDLARELASLPADPGGIRPSTLALAGAVAAGATPGEGGTADALVAAREAGVERRAGVAVPTDDPADLAHSTLVHARFSGDPDEVPPAIEAIGWDPEGVDPTGSDPDAARDLASLVALRAAGDDAAPSAGVAVERALRPHATGGPFATVGGLADVLDATARESPGTAVALALGHDARTAALSAWREHARLAHGAVRSATTARHDGLLAASVDAGPVGTTARLLAAYRSPEPLALVVGDGEAALALAPDAAGPDPTGPLRAAASGLDPGAEVGASSQGAYARFEAPPAGDALVEAVREALR